MKFEEFWNPTKMPDWWFILSALIIGSGAGLGLVAVARWMAT